MSDTPAEVTLPGLAQRVEIIEKRLGIDPLAVVADAAASAQAGADAHVGNAQSDVEPPVVPGSPEDALAAASSALDESKPQDALDHVNRALEKWPEDADLLAAKSDLEAEVAAAQAEEPPATS